MSKYLNLKHDFEKNRNNDEAISMALYMKNNFDFYGIPANIRKEIEKKYILSDKMNKKIDWDFLNQCYDDQYREMQYVVLDYLDSLSFCLTYEDIKKIEVFVSKKQWWDSIDKLDKIIGNISYNDKRIDDLMLKWSIYENIWYRRLAIDHQQSRKLNTNKELLKQLF